MKFRGLWIILVLAANSIFGQQIEGDRIELENRKIAGLPGTQEQIHQKTRDWFGTNFASPEEIINESSLNRIAASYYDDCTVVDRRVFFNHDMIIYPSDNTVTVQLWVRDQRDKDKTAREFFYKKDGTVKRSVNKSLAQLVAKGQFFVSELEEYLKTK